MVKYRLIVPPEMSGTRLDIFLATMLPEYSRSFWQDRIRDDSVTVVGKEGTAHRKMRSGEVVLITISKPLEPNAEPELIPIRVLYDDREIIVVEKPRGMTVHPCPNVVGGTLVNTLRWHCSQLSDQGDALRPGIVHRLDKVTSGLMVVAKTNFAHNSLGSQFRDRSVQKKYYALAIGTLPPLPREIDLPLGRHPVQRHRMTVLPAIGRSAKTLILSATSVGNIHLLDIQIFTGRTHQIRVHLRSLGMSILGDHLYGGRDNDRAINQELAAMINQLNGVALHSYQLEFEHPTLKKRMMFRSPLPSDLCQILELAKRKHSG